MNEQPNPCTTLQSDGDFSRINTNINCCNGALTFRNDFTSNMSLLPRAESANFSVKGQLFSILRFASQYNLCCNCTIQPPQCKSSHTQYLNEYSCITLKCFFAKRGAPLELSADNRLPIFKLKETWCLQNWVFCQIWDSFLWCINQCLSL